MRESCFGSGTQGKQDCYEYHQGRTEVNMRQKKRDGIWGYIFIAPQVIGLLLFSIIPIICVFYFSFCKWDAISEPVFVGIQNYITEFHDPAFYKAIVETNYPAFTVPRGFKCRNNREINDIHTNLITSIYCSKPSSITSPVESKRTELRALR